MKGWAILFPLRTLSERHILENVFGCHLWAGTLMASAGVSYLWEEKARKYTAKNGMGYRRGVLGINKHWFQSDISPYVVPGDPTSGLLPRYQKEESWGKAQRWRIRSKAIALGCVMRQIYPEIGIPFPKPRGLRPHELRIFGKVLKKQGRKGIGSKNSIPYQTIKRILKPRFLSVVMNIWYEITIIQRLLMKKKEIIKEHENYQKDCCGS